MWQGLSTVRLESFTKKERHVCEHRHGRGFDGPPRIEIVRMVEQGDTVMAELTAEATRDTGEVMRLSMAEVFVMRGGLICERRAWVIELKGNEFK